MSKVHFRDVNPFLQKVRNFLLGRKATNALRFAPEVATRSPPPPELPDGPSHRLNTNYYFARDARREVAPPLVLATSHGQIEAAASPKSPEVKALPTPGPVHIWDK